MAGGLVGTPYGKSLLTLLPLRSCYNRYVTIAYATAFHQAPNCTRLVPLIAKSRINTMRILSWRKLTHNYLQRYSLHLQIWRAIVAALKLNKTDVDEACL